MKLSNRIILKGSKKMKKSKMLTLIAISTTLLLLIGCNSTIKTEEQNEILSEKANSDKVEESNNEDVETIEDNSKEEIVEEENLKIEQRAEDIGNYEVNAYVYALNESGEKVWEKAWEKLKLTELDVMSGIAETNDGVIYVEVYGDLYAIDKNTGNELWGQVAVGATQTPVVDKDGTIYCIGYYGPFITAISPEGSTKWTRNYQEIYWPYEIYLSDSKIYVRYESSEEDGLAIFLKDGTFIGENLTGEKPFNKAIASSELKASSVSTYNASNVLDGNPETAWVEGVQGQGLNEYIEITADTPQEISVIEIKNGYWKSYESFDNNSNAKRIQIELSNGKTIEKELKGGIYDPNYIVFEEPVKSDSIKITILDVNAGEKYEDTCISEINVY
jgi:outer membrane protein assembly factor BamB